MRGVRPLPVVLCLLVPSIARAQATMLADTSTAPTSTPLIASKLVELDGWLYFLGSRQFGYTYAGFELWRTDGTTVEEVRQIEEPFSFRLTASASPLALLQVAGGRLYIPLWSGEVGRLWVSDGSAAGTTRLDFYTLSTQVRRGWFGELAGNPTLFSGYDETNGTELWIVDGASAHLLVDLEPGPASSYPASFTETPHGVIFFARGRLYRSDGTAAGTVELAVNDGGVGYLGELGGHSILGGAGLWESDGTRAGTSSIAALHVGAGVQLEDAIMLTAGGELWIYDGAGLRQIPGPVGVRELVVAGGRAFFLTTRGLWQSDGTVAGTSSIAATPNAGGLTPFASEVAFIASDGIYASDGSTVRRISTDHTDALTGVQDRICYFVDHRLRQSDGVTTTTIIDFALQQTDSSFSSVAPAGGQVLLQLHQGLYLQRGVGRRVWRSDGTPAGTAPAFTLPDPGDGFYFDLAELNGSSAFLEVGFPSSEWKLWTSDGTEAGTSPAVIGSKEEIGLALQLHDGVRHFVVVDGEGTFITDGTQAGTMKLFPQRAVTASGDVTRSFLLAFDDATGERTLYQTDGTTAGTQYLGIFAAGFYTPPRVAIADERALITSRGALIEAGGTLTATNVLVPDGVTTAPAVAGGRIYFGRSQNGVHGLWTIDAAGVGRMVAEVNVNNDTPPEPLGDRLLFVGSRPNEGTALWISDGTRAGTRSLTPLRSIFVSTAPRNLLAIGDRAIFLHDDGLHGRELWITDGTEAGTRLLDDAIPGPDGVATHLSRLTVAGDHIYFSGYSIDHGFEPWSLPLIAVTCGNGSVDANEACDGDPCCDSTCKAVAGCPPPSMPPSDMPPPSVNPSREVPPAQADCACSAAERRRTPLAVLAILLCCLRLGGARSRRQSRR